MYTVLMNEFEEAYYNEYDPSKNTATIGAIMVSVPPSVAEKAHLLFEAYKQSDSRGVYISPFFSSIPFTPLEKLSFEAFAVSCEQKNVTLKTSLELLTATHLQKLRPLTFFELLALITQYPEYQREDKKLVTLATIPDQEGLMRVPCFEPGVTMRQLSTQFFSSSWDNSYRFFFTHCHCKECLAR